MTKIFIFTALTIFLTGCGGSSNDSGTSTPDDKEKDAVMVPLESYSVYSGNKVVKGSENAVLQVTHTYGEDKSIVVLLEGNATIIRNP